MSRRGNADLRCERCRLHRPLCFCDLVPSLATTTSLTLLLHRDEAQKPTNSGALAARCLLKSRVVVVDPQQPLPAVPPPPASRRQLVLFPGDGAHVLDGNFVVGGGVDDPVDLVVPDGTWRQVKKMRARLPGLADLPCVTLPPTTATAWRLRAETRDHGLATLEAVAAALRVLEGDAGDAVADALLAVFRVQVDRTLWLRGALGDDEVSGGIPEAARRHDPRGGTTRAP